MEQMHDQPGAEPLRSLDRRENGNVVGRCSMLRPERDWETFRLSFVNAYKGFM